MPENVGVPIGDKIQGYTHIVVQVHYFTKFEGLSVFLKHSHFETFTGNVVDYSGITVRAQAEKPQKFASVYRVGQYGGSIPARRESK